ncbi:MAG: SusC/RagA family TonB-linked outer membrane protein, partial [Candidatus Cryptobacteroides sp.]
MKKSILIIFSFVLLAMQALSAQTLSVSGTVTAADDGTPLPGVSVVIKGTVQGTFTDIDGLYNIEVSAGQTLLFSSIGFAEHEVKVTQSGRIDVALAVDSEMLEEVVAIGYGVMKKSDLTGSVTSVKGDQLTKTPAAGLDQALQGVAAGVTVNSNTGQPGAAAEVRIRGIGTVNDSAPIYVVDGVIVDNITYLSPNDIVSTEILKDASATAIYGSRGANGVILVTTKKGGEDGRVSVSFDAYVGVQTRWRSLDLMNASEFADFCAMASGSSAQVEKLKNEGLDAWVRAYLTGNKSLFYPKNLDYGKIDTDWQDVVFRNALIQNYHINVSGGSGKGGWSMSANWYDQDGTIIGSDFTRLSLRANASYDIAKWLRIGENLTFMTSEGRNAMNNNSSPGASILSAAIAMAPWDPARYPEGAVNVKNEDMSGQISAASNFKNVVNPLSMVEYSHPSDKTERWVGDVFLEIKPVKGLTWRSDVSLDLTNIRHKVFKDAYKHSEYDKNDKNFLESSMARYSNIIVENTLTYARDIAKHSFSVMVGQTAEQYEYETIGGSGASILNPVETNWYLSQTTENQTKAGDSANRSRRFSLLGRAHYSYDSRYMVTVNFRADGSSKFRNHIYGFFPSVAAAWRIGNESWLKEVSWLEDLKIRAGWGRIGNDKIGDNAFLLTVMNTGPTFVDYVLGADQQLANGATILTYVNNDGKWETTEQWNAGVDFGFWGNKLTGNVDVFVRDTKDMLLSVMAPAQVGNRYSATANVGTVRNQGVEITLNHRNQVGKFAYSIGGNVSFISNELTALNGGEKVW